MGAWLSENTNVCWLLPLSKNTSQPLSFNLLSAATNLLHEIDQATQAVMEAVAKAQELRPGSSAGVVEFGPGVPALRLDRAVGFGDACVRSYHCTVPALANAFPINREHHLHSPRRCPLWSFEDTAGPFCGS